MPFASLDILKSDLLRYACFVLSRISQLWSLSILLSWFASLHRYSIGIATVNAQWMSRGALQGEVSRAADVYSFGVLLLEIASGHPPWPTMKDSEVWFELNRVCASALLDCHLIFGYVILLKQSFCWLAQASFFAPWCCAWFGRCMR